MKSGSSVQFFLTVVAVGAVIVVAASFITLFWLALPAAKAFGIKFILEKNWDPVSEKFGAFPFLLGTLLTSFLALLISIPFSLAIGLTVAEYLKNSTSASILKTLVEVSAGIPSVIYGFWGLFFLVPLVRNLEIKIGVSPYGVGIFSASLILAMMIIPYSASFIGEAIQLVPQDLKEATYALGATRLELIKNTLLPFARSSIIAGMLLSLGRALGETMAVTMVIGNSNFIPKSLFAPGNTMASIIANEFTEATGLLHRSSLIELACLLFLVTAVLNMTGKYIIHKTAVGSHA